MKEGGVIYMKNKIMFAVLLLLLVIGVAFVSIKPTKTPQPSSEAVKIYKKDCISLSEFGTGNSKGKILEVSSDQLEQCVEMQQKKSEVFTDFIKAGGIVVFKTQGTNHDMHKLLAVPIGDASSKDKSQDTVVASIIYSSNRGKFAVNYINVKKMSDFKVDMVADVVKSVKYQKSIWSKSASEEDDDKSISDTEDEYKELGFFDYHTFAAEKGLIRESYRFYTVQDLSGYDYYLIKADIGLECGALMPKYKRYNYVGKKLYLRMGSNDEFVLANLAEPRTTIHESEYYLNANLGDGIDDILNQRKFLSTKRHINFLNIETKRDKGFASWNVKLYKIDKKHFQDFDAVVSVKTDCNDDEVNLWTDCEYYLSKNGVIKAHHEFVVTPDKLYKDKH